jgi:hypothetical protein
MNDSRRISVAPAPRRYPLDLILTILLGGAAFALYLATLAPTILAGDGGEFQFVPYLLGVAHPTGYPLYCLLGWAWSHLLPFGDVAYRMNLFSAFWAALAVGLLYPVARILLCQAIPQLSPAANRQLAVLASVTFAVTPTLWSQSIIAEVYSLHIFFVVLILYLLLIFGQEARNGTPAHRYLLLAAGCFGLSLAHHRTTVLLAPAALVYVWLVDRRTFSRWRRVGIPALFLVFVPLALYLYIPWRAPHTAYLHQPLAAGRDLILYDNTPASLLDFVLGGPFGGSLDLTVNLGARLAMAWGLLRDQVGWIGVVLALTGVIRLVVTRRWTVLALTGLIYGVTVAFDLVYTIGDIYVLFIPSYLVIVLWLAAGVGSLAQIGTKAWSWLSSRDAHAPAPNLRSNQFFTPLATILVIVPFFALPFWLAATQYAAVDQSQNTRARTRWEEILAEPLPEKAVLVSDDRNNIMPMWYLQYVDGQRPDLLGLFPLITPEYPTLGPVLDLAMGTERPVYLIKEMPGVEAKVDVKADGGLWHVVGPAVTGDPQYATNARLADAVVLTGYDRRPRSPQPGEALNISLYWQTLRPLGAEYHTFVHLLDGAGNKVAQSDRQPGGVYYPSTLWQPGERLRDDHLLTVPAGAQPGVYRLLVGMYALSAGGALEPLGEPVIAGQLAVKEAVQVETGPIAHPTTADFGGEIELLGYDAVRQGTALDVTLQWRCLRPPAVNYTVFIHVLDAGGNTVAQADSQPMDGAYPTAVWDAGEVVADFYSISLPPDLPAGGYRLRIGLYRLESGERLPVVGDGDSVELGTVDTGD